LPVAFDEDPLVNIAEKKFLFWGIFLCKFLGVCLIIRSLAMIAADEMLNKTIIKKTRRSLAQKLALS
jgi:hypothetical protein